MPNFSSDWLKNYEARQYHPKTMEALAEACDVELESKLHYSIMEYLHSRDIPYYHSRMDKRTTGNKGAPDFFIFLSSARTLHIECKRRGEKPTDDQLSYHAWLAKKGHTVYVVHNMNEFLSALKLQDQEILSGT